MQENYTYDALIQFMYREMPAEEAVNMAQMIEEDFDLHRMYDSLLLAKTQLPKVQFNPSPAVLTNILQYSTKTALEAQC